MNTRRFICKYWRERERERERMINEIKVIQTNCIRQWRRCSNYKRIRAYRDDLFWHRKDTQVEFFFPIYTHSCYYARGSLHKSDIEKYFKLNRVYFFFFLCRKLPIDAINVLFLFRTLFNSFYKFVDRIALKISPFPKFSLQIIFSFAIKNLLQYLYIANMKDTKAIILLCNVFKERERVK